MTREPPRSDGHGPADEPPGGEEDRLRRRREQLADERAVRLGPGDVEAHPETTSLERMHEYRDKQRRRLERERQAEGEGVEDDEATDDGEHDDGDGGSDAAGSENRKDGP
jgi:hypothetical protein